MPGLLRTNSSDNPMPSLFWGTASYSRSLRRGMAYETRQMHVLSPTGPQALDTRSTTTGNIVDMEVLTLNPRGMFFY